jgi:hypothetical protein
MATGSDHKSADLREIFGHGQSLELVADSVKDRVSTAELP